MSKHNELKKKKKVGKTQTKKQGRFFASRRRGRGVLWELGDGGAHCAKKGLMYQDVYRSNAAYKGVIEISK